MPQKKQIKIATEINEIIIVNNKKLNPYLELVNFSSRNIDQKKLGTILGIFEIKDLSDDSAYIVNFLASVAKKTYFASHQKSPEDSFESTLAKVNLSLAEIANHGNVNWIGKIDAVFCSIFENQINFSVSGDAKVLLLRNERLIEISESLSPKDEAVNPLKTFTDIASGRLEVGDKLILTTDDISHIFTIEDLEKHALSFDNEKFVRFLKTALVNELEIAGTIVLDAKEKIEEPQKKVVSVESEIAPEKIDKNLFGSKAFEKKNSPAKYKKEKSSKSSAKKDSEKTYTHQKTGHIYITDSGEDFDAPSENKYDEWLALAKEKLSDFSFWFKEDYIKKTNYKIKRSFTNLISQLKTKSESPVTKPRKTEEKYTLPPVPSIKTEKISKGLRDKFSSIKNRFEKTPSISSADKTLPTNIPSLKDNSHKFINLIKSLVLKFIKLISVVLPKLSMVKKSFLGMNLKFKVITLFVIISIFVVPFVLIKINSEPQPANIEAEAKPSEDLKVNPSTQTYKEATDLYQDSNLIGSFVFNNSVFAIGKNKITSIGEGGKDYPFPDNFRNAKLYSFMSDLKLLFLINENNQLISFSPISLKFNNDAISIESNVKIERIESYLTYLYMIDSNNKQIYRYPRAENGFGEKINWLQGEVNLEEVEGLAIDGNLYIAQDDSIIKLFNRKLQSFELKKDANSSVNEIFTNENVSSLYVLDKMNGELDKYDKEGNKQSFVSNQELTQASKIWVDEKNSLAYFITDKSLFKITLP